VLRRWGDASTILPVTVDGADSMASIHGAGCASGTSPSREAVQADKVKSRAQASKLVADLQLRR
jgi:hypothetical protein